MIKLTTDCAKCNHERVCQYKYNARNAMDKLNRMDYIDMNGSGDWNTMMQRRHVDITFSCPSFERKQEIGIRGGK